MFTTFLLLLPLLFALAAWAGARRAMKIARLAETPCAVEIPAETVPASPLPSSPEPPRQRPKKPTLSHTKSNLDALIAEHEAFMREFNRERRERYAEYRRQGLLPPLKPRKHRKQKADAPETKQQIQSAPKQIPPMPSFFAHRRRSAMPSLTSHTPPAPPPPSPAAQASSPTQSPTTQAPPIQTAPIPTQPTQPQPAPRPAPQSTIPLPRPPRFTLRRILAPLSKILAAPWRIVRPALTLLPRLCTTLFLRRPPASDPPQAQSSAPPLQNRAA